MINVKEQKRSFLQPTHNHDHHEHGGKIEVFLFFIGLFCFIIALFIPITFVQNIFFSITLLLAGYHIIIEGFIDTIKHTVRLRKFMPNVHILMTFAAVGAILIGEFREASLLILIFAGAHYLEDYAKSKSTKEITNLLALHPTNARRLLPNGETEIIDVKHIKVGDHLLVLHGDKIPTDGIILSGQSTIDEAAITGESIPVVKTSGDLVYASTINNNGTFTMEVTKDSSETVFAKIISLVQQTKTNVSKTAATIKKFIPIYVTSVLLVAPLFFLVGYYIFKWTFDDSFYRTMVFLIATSPCALAVTDIPATLSAISNLAKRGVLFKGGSSLANVAHISLVAFDKTGTLTAGVPTVTDVYFNKQLSNDEVNFYQSIIVSMEQKANHPLANAIIRHFNDVEIFDLEVNNEIGSGLIGHYDGKIFKIGKPSSISEVDDAMKLATEKLEKEGKTVIYFSEGNHVLCLIAIQDIATENAKNVIEYFKNENIHTVMISGDAQRTAEAIGKQLNIDEVRGNVLPEEKANIITEMKQSYPIVAMIGDGVNDAPALVSADIGIAMGKGTDIAIDVADGVLVKNDLSKFAYTHRLAKKLRKVVWQNITIALLVVIFLIIVNIFGKVNIALAVIIHEGSTLLVILNGLRLLKVIK